VCVFVCSDHDSSLPLVFLPRALFAGAMSGSVMK
jgi:hypothetical protein